MNHQYTQKLKLPEPLLISEPSSFAQYTFTNRIPKIIDQILAENSYESDVSQRLESLKVEIRDGCIRYLEEQTVPDAEQWKEYIEAFVGKRWSETPFLFAEAYFYRRILEITRYFQLHETQRVDPFKLQKELGLRKSLGQVRNICTYLTPKRESGEDDIRKTLKSIIYLTLWGNRSDLSFRPSKAGTNSDDNLTLAIERDNIIIDGSDVLSNKMCSKSKARIDLIADNSGLELIADLWLSNFLLEHNIAETVYLHLKAYPTFVSDATLQDVLFTLELLCQDSDKTIEKFGISLKDYHSQSRLILVDDTFWNSPLEFWHIPEHLTKEFNQSALIIFKGDANYRRLIGDCHWDVCQDFSEVVSYFPSDIVAIRTLKSEVIIGLEEQVVRALNQFDRNWLINGQYGIIQLN